MSEPNVVLYIALIAYLPFVAACFWILGGRRGMLVSLLAGWLFLPWFSPVGRSIPLLHGKDMFVPAIVLAASLLLDGQAWRGFRPRLLDLPVAVICLSPLFTSLANDFGWYDGGSGLFETFHEVGRPLPAWAVSTSALRPRCSRLPGPWWSPDWPTCRFASGRSG